MAPSTDGLPHTLRAVSQVCVVLRAPMISKIHAGTQQPSQVTATEGRRQQPLCAPWSLTSSLPFHPQPRCSYSPIQLFKDKTYKKKKKKNYQKVALVPLMVKRLHSSLSRGYRESRPALLRGQSLVKVLAQGGGVGLSTNSAPLPPAPGPAPAGLAQAFPACVSLPLALISKENRAGSNPSTAFAKWIY